MVDIDPAAKQQQEVALLRQKNAYQLSLLEDERRITDELLANKSRAIEALQHKLQLAEKRLVLETETAKSKLEEVSSKRERDTERR